MCVVLWNFIKNIIDSGNYDTFVCKIRKRESMRLYQHIYVYKNH